MRAADVPMTATRRVQATTTSIEAIAARLFVLEEMDFLGLSTARFPLGKTGYERHEDFEERDRDEADKESENND